MPENFRVAKVRIVDVENRVAFVLGPRSTAIVAEGKVLNLLAATMPGVNCDHWRLITIAETG